MEENVMGVYKWEKNEIEKMMLVESFKGYEWMGVKRKHFAWKYHKNE